MNPRKYTPEGCSPKPDRKMRNHRNSVWILRPVQALYFLIHEEQEATIFTSYTYILKQLNIKSPIQAGNIDLNYN
jgi:hypothetical protein